MPVIVSDEQTLLRQEGHRSSFYASFLKPLTLWTARVDSLALTRSDRAIPFDTGAGLAYTEVEAYQVVWVGTAAGDNDLGELRIKSVSSADAGVTGTVNVEPNNVIWADDLFLTFKHNYPFKPMYPYIDGAEVFYKDRDITWTDETTDPTPVGVWEFSHRADWIRDGEACFWVDGSDSYAVKSGATISSYALTVYPSAGVTVTINAGTGVGRIVVTSLTQDYYWCKCTVTDSNSKSQTTWHCIFVHDPDKTGSTYPHVDFELESNDDNWERGGVEAKLSLHDNATLTDIPDRTFAVLWKESLFGMDQVAPVKIRVGNMLYVNPRLTYTVAPGAPNTVTLTFHAGVIVDGAVAADGTTITIDALVSGAVTQTGLNNTTTDGQVSIASAAFANADAGGTITIKDNATADVVLTQTYLPGQIVTASADYPSPLFVFPQNSCVGYVGNEKLLFDIGPTKGTGQDAIVISSIEAILKNEFMFSISLAARPDGQVGEWYEYAKWLTIGRAIHHIWKWHSTLFEVANVKGLLDNTDGRAYAEFEDGSLYTMPDNMARNAGIRAHIVTDRDGTINLVQDAQLLIDADRAALDTAMTITYADRSGEIAIPREPIDRVAFVYGSGLAFAQGFSPDESGADMPDVTAYCAVAPGAIPSGEGEGTINLERQVLVSQDQLNQLVGRVYAQQNNLYPSIDITFHGDYTDVIKPSIAEFFEIDIASGDTIKGIIEPDLRLIPRSVGLSVKEGKIETKVTFEPEMDADIGVTTECPGLPTIEGVAPAIPANIGLPGALVTGGSVYRKPPNTSAWTLLTAESTNDLIQDVWWRNRTGLLASSSAILFRCGLGYIKRSTDGGTSWSDVSPAAPPNSYGDAIAPTLSATTFQQMDSSYITLSTFAAVANWQNPDGDWRAWLAKTTDDGATWGYVSLGTGTVPGCSGVPSSEQDNTGTTHQLRSFSTDNSIPPIIVEVDTDKYVIFYGSSDDKYAYVQALTVNWTTDTITWGTPVQITDSNNGTLSSPRPGSLCFVATDKFAVCYQHYAGAGTGSPRVRVATLSGTTITLGSASLVLTTAELGEWESVSADAGQDVAAVSDGTNLYHFRHGKVAGQTNRWYTINRATISGTTLTWDTIAGPAGAPWLSASVSDFTLVQEEPNSGTTGITLADFGSGSWAVALVERLDTPTDYKHHVIAGSGRTFGTSIEVDMDASGSLAANLVSLSATDLVLFYWYDAGTLKAIYLTRSANVLTQEDEITLWTVDAVYPYEWRMASTSLSSTSFVVSWPASSSCVSAIEGSISVSGGSISIDRSCIAFSQHRSGVRWTHWMIGGDTALEWLQIYGDNLAGSASTGFILSTSQISDDCQTLHDDARALGLSIGRVTGATAWVTAHDPVAEILELLEVTSSVANRYSLGAATEAELTALYNKVAQPESSFAAEDTVYVGGRMAEPQGLGLPGSFTQVLKFSGGSTWTAIANRWDPNWAGAIAHTPGGYLFVVRNKAVGSPKLYWNAGAGDVLALLSTADMTAGVEPHGIAFDRGNGTVVLCSRLPGRAVMVVASPFPYLTWVDITFDHGITYGINAVEVL